MKILAIEDDEFDFLFLKRSLERAFSAEDVSIEWVVDPKIEQLVEIIDDFDICFVDQGLPNTTGTALIKEMTLAGVQTPMILLTGDLRPELDQDALEAGASDFIHKDKLSISSVFRSTRHCITRKDQERRLREMAYTDPLTSLANRAAFDERCKSAISRVRSRGRNLTLIVLDLDGFKKVNDTYGHPCGDRLLQLFSNELRSKFKENDLVARLGGDEFAILVESEIPTGPPHSVRTALNASLETSFLIDNVEIKSGTSIGVSIVDASQGEITPTDLLHRADRNLYLDKRRRKFAKSHGVPLERISDLDLDETVQNLEQAISQNNFELFYQPKVNYKSGKITGLEALLRWNGSESKLGPDIFIPIAEEYGLINDIGAWVLRQACWQLKEWIGQGLSVPVLAINVSPLQLESATFHDIVSATLMEFDVAPDRIEFELTEGSFDGGAETRIQQMTLISELGCSWAIDDFGIGYSSLSRLHKLPISKIKIDKSFLSQLPNDHAARDISNTIISMARNLQLDVVAEGVEDINQLNGLHLAETDELQGYHCFRPMNAENVSKFLNRQTIEAA